MKDLFEIFISFFKISSVTFGGGYVMLPILQREVVEDKKWVTEERVIDYYAISQGLPGIIAINVAIFIGKERKGVLGGIAGALGIVAPCLLIITFIAAFLSNFQNNPIVRNAFAGIAVCVSALILNSVIVLWKKSVVDRIGIFVFMTVLVGMLYFSISPIILIVISAFAGVLARKLIGGYRK